MTDTTQTRHGGHIVHAANHPHVIASCDCGWFGKTRRGPRRLKKALRDYQAHVVGAGR